MTPNRLKAYLTFRSQSQALIRFAVLVSYSVPALRDEIAAAAASSKPWSRKVDFFHKSDQSTPADLLQTETTYEQLLATYLLIAQFSFFEACISDSIKELIDFHGGEKDFVERAARKTKRFMAPIDQKLAKDKRKLQTTEKPNASNAYWTSARALAEKGFRFPGELFSSYGLKTLIMKQRKLKAHEIPSILVDALQLDLSLDEIQRLEEIREIRNHIAHGNPPQLTMRDVVGMNKFLREIAVKLADHLSEHYLLIEKYAP
ncbi:MAG TPA: HEPN domain-containing protein [Candidatus Eremiobacteraceae bacterium]|nr:HEPN domain-containing protein [Candidatus Eremiobacteraceae bacterium]